MAKRELSDVQPGQIWRDRDKRMSSGNRCVKVLRLEPREAVNIGAMVVYRSLTGFGPELKSMRPRFQRAFDLVAARPTREDTSQ